MEYWLEGWAPSAGRVFLDIGANLGMWARELAPRFGWVHAVEPNPAALPALRDGLPENVTIHAVGAWHCETTLAFTQYEDSAHLSSFFTGGGINTGPALGTIELPCRPIDALGIAGPVDFLKCDAEGAELECLLGAERLIGRDRPWLLVEAHTEHNFLALARLLAQWNYLFTIVRHPDYAQFSRLWFAHCWFACQPMPKE